MAAVQMIIHCIILPTDSKHKCNARKQIASRVISLYVNPASDTETLMIYINLLSFNMVIDATELKKKKKLLLPKAAVYPAQDLLSLQGHI